MERLKQKLKMEKQVKDSGKDKYPLFITDVKSIKENLKIKEILRTVKMNSSMRIKAPRGSKIMSNKDFTEDDCFEETSVNQNSSEPLSAVNPDVHVAVNTEGSLTEETSLYDNLSNLESGNETQVNISEETDITESDEVPKETNSDNLSQKNVVDNRSNHDISNDNLNTLVSNGKLGEKIRDRKLSLDHTMLSRQDGFSQSELDLHTIGKSPLERKYSFFRKKMDSFVRNTTEMFRRQNSSLQRRVSMSVSLQSLNEKCSTNDSGNTQSQYQEESRGSRASLQMPSPMMRSTSSISLMPSSSSQTSLASSQPALHALSTPTLESIHSNSTSAHSLNEIYLKEPTLNSRAISMNSGLDAPFGRQRRKASRSNRVTWIASEGLTNYFRRKIQDEKTNEMQTCHSYQDFSCIPENEQYSQKPNTKGRRLSYQRAVSGEDPMPMPVKYQDSLSRKKHLIPENHEANFELANYLTEFTTKGVPVLSGFDVEPVPEETFAYLLWATKPENIEDVFNWKTLPPKEEARQAVIRELIYTEADYIKHLMAIVEVFIAAAHDIQCKGKMLNIDTAKLFSNLPDVLNASLCFWHLAFMPMITDAVQNSKPFNTNLMSFGFSCFKEIFIPYERFVVDQSKLLEYYRKKQQTEAEFAMYLSWCHSQKQCNRLQLNDLLVKPMQRMTKYSLILRRILDYTVNESDRAAIEMMENFTKRNVTDLNRCVRQREELDKLDQLESTIENFEVDIKDDEAERICKTFAKLNLKAPMLYCLPIHSRNLLHQGELRFRDGAKEIDVRVLLLTDMLLVCRKLVRGNAYQYKQIRPKYMLDKMVQIPKFVSKNNKDLSSLLYVLVDDLGSAYTSFVLSEMSKDPNPQLTLKTMENKFKEAKLTYELMTIIAHNPNKELSKADVMTAAEYTNTKSRYPSEEGLIEQEALERVATMTHRSMGASTDRDFSNISLKNKSFEGTTYAPSTEIVIGASARMPGRNKKCCIMHRTSNVQAAYTPRDSQSASSQPTPRARTPEPKASSSRLLSRIETFPDRLQELDTDGSSSVTVRVSEIDSEMTKPLETTSLLHLSPSKSSESSSNTQSTLRVQPQNNVATLIYSLPDVTIEPCTPRTTSSPTQPSASEKMYQSHHEQLQKNRFMASQTQQYLTPDNRGSSYPPPSPTRASLKRSLAFSYSVKNPPLTKMGHVSSQSQPDTAYYSHSQDERGGSPKPGTSTEKLDRKSKLSSSRSSSKKTDSEDRQSDSSPTRKDEKRDSIYRDEYPDLYRRGGSTCSSYRDESSMSTFRHGSTDLSFRDKSTSSSHRDESPGTSDRYEISAEPSYKEISPYSSIQGESPSQSQRDESDRGILEVSSGPRSIWQSTDIVPAIDGQRSDNNIEKPDSHTYDKEQTGCENSDSFLKQQSLSFSYDSSRSHKDETSYSDHKEYYFSPGFEERSFKDQHPETSVQEDSIGMIQFPGTSYNFGSINDDSSSQHSHDKSNTSQDDDHSSTRCKKCGS